MDKTAPGRLELVRAFLNTADLETGADQFRTAAGLERWLTKQKLIPGPPAPPECDGKELETAGALREALRAPCLANNGLQTHPHAPPAPPPPPAHPPPP